MYRFIYNPLKYIVIFLLFLLWSGSAMATQTHGEPEGLVSHMIAHAIFFAAMVYFCFRLVRSKEYSQKGWRWIFYAFMIFALWNLDTLFVHYYREVLNPQVFIGDLYGLKRTFHADSFLDLIFYVGRFDHIFSLPALLCLFLGIRSLLQINGEQI